MNHYVVKETHDLKFHVTLEDADPHVEWVFRTHNREFAEDFCAMLNMGAVSRSIKNFSMKNFGDGAW